MKFKYLAVTPIILNIIAITALLSVVVWGVRTCKSGLEEMTEKSKNVYEVYIGQQFTLDGRTLTIIDYSMFEEQFTLSDGTRVHQRVVVPNP